MSHKEKIAQGASHGMASPLGGAAAHRWPRRGVCATLGTLAAARWAGPPLRPPAAEALGYPVPEERQGGGRGRPRAKITSEMLYDEGPSEEEAAQEEGTLVTLDSGIQYRELAVGNVGDAAEVGSICECVAEMIWAGGRGPGADGGGRSIQYTVYKLSAGAYFKYSSGGRPVYLFSLGFGKEGKDGATPARRDPADCRGTD